MTCALSSPDLHHRVVRLLEVLEGPASTHMVLEYAAGGSLQQLIDSDGPLSEPRARGLMRSLVEAVQHCHERCVSHRDIKLENILLEMLPRQPAATPATEAIAAATTVSASEHGAEAAAVFSPAPRVSVATPATPALCIAAGPPSTPATARIATPTGAPPLIKLIDFGLSAIWEPGKLLATTCGTLTCMAPEMVRGERYAGPAVDIWSMGIALYCMLSGQLPFEGASEKELRRKIIRGQFALPLGVSEEARDLVSRMLTLDPERRISLDEIENHAWLCQP